MVVSRLSSRLGRQVRVIMVAIAATIVLISGLLIYKSLPVSFQEYKQYRDQVIQLNELEANFSQEVLKARYELFAYYDPIVNNLTAQGDTLAALRLIPSFVSAGDQQEIRTALETRQASLEQRENLSEWFKARNALLKNSLRYLPFLSDQIDEKLSDPKLVETLEAANVATLDNTLNQLIRNLLLFTATTDEGLSTQLQTLLASLNRLQNTLEVSEADLPLQLVQSHANVIFNAKPLIEEVTAQLLQPLDTSTAPIASTLEASYRLALANTRVYRFLMYAWFLMLLIGGILWLQHQKQKTQITLSKSYSQVETMAAALDHILSPRSENESSKVLSDLTAYTTQENSLGRLAKGILRVKTDLNHRQPVTARKD
ncbi:hypothetical protein IQ260_12215 [Leptolyngbya cf. ectocarpi LEGE 11479]|uniref:DAHL domain-containing protein n=1 Tax=Leptolyngbya cf. ectocarpi LEGE 11479 TaxID=1828722 RepID=A0A928ZU01_LEPEC|nr:DAHL domain-containing protein [Leptolyngbya ectocarpi]MBE9067421.1 hypothetical protein [Leptolyngbya cf. ectocarpi LEGE 11479]